MATHPVGTTRTSRSERASDSARATVPTLTSRGRVAVAMSGGVDSSVVAAMLTAAGHDAFGVTLQLYDHGTATGRPGSCCAGRDVRDARRVADQLGIPHYTLDYEQQFRAAVIDDFVDSYVAGETPLPCVRCNQRIKFRDLLAVTRDLGADWLATGHYVRRVDGPRGAELHEAADARRDQSFFLFATTPEQLARLRFPLGDLPSKDETRRLAEHYGLPVASKPDSQDICFVPSGRYAELVAKLHPAAGQPGAIVDTRGRHLGEHSGIENFTIGQRRGLGLGGADALYVVRIDAERREVVVGPADALRVNPFTVHSINWLGATAFPEAPVDGWRVRAKIRSNAPAHAATVTPDDAASATVRFDDPETAVAPGQACVFYEMDGTRLLGGGWIRTPQLRPNVVPAAPSISQPELSVRP